ncbi:MAG: TSUP family transporter [Pseudomonadales bacterium]|nr:TSUP family transporter [Pseudomonadales bacterium]
MRATPRAVFVATLVSGFMSTISSIGGPPLALVYQNARGAELRANLSVLFILGCTISLLALALIGKFTRNDLAYAAVLMLGLIPGILVSGPFRKHIDKKTARPWLLGLCLLSAMLVLGRAFVNQ